MEINQFNDCHSTQGRISEATTDHEPTRLSLETKDRDEMTLMRLRRLTRTVMCKSERHRFEARTLQRSNIIKYLEDNLMHSSQQIRSLSLELLCCIIPKLGSKIDYLLKPLLPKVFQCLKKSESNELKTKALHFLRGYFRHTRRISGFIDDFVKLGIQNSDPAIQISCCLGLNIIFDQDLGNNLSSRLVVPIANVLKQKNSFELARAAYRTLKCIHNLVKDNRFRDLINMAHPDAAEMYKNMLQFEDMDSFLTMENNDCSTVILEYQIKRDYLNLTKDFGILDPIILHDIQESRNCDRARAVSNLYIALKNASWNAVDLDPHIIDFLKIIKCFTSDTNRLVQMYGFDILKEIINRIGFTLSPYIHWIIDILEPGLISANSKIKMKVHRVLHKLMRCLHPMTVVWNLLSTKDALIKEAVFMLIRSMLNHFSYHEFDMIALCNYLGPYLEDSNIKLSNSSRECIILLFDMMRDCPAYGIKTKAIRLLLKNQNLHTQTLKDIGIIGNVIENDYQEDFESLSDEEFIDQDTSSLSESTTVISSALSRRSLITADDSNGRCMCICRHLNYIKSFSSLSRNPSVLQVQGKHTEISDDISSTITLRCPTTAGESDVKYDDILKNNDSLKIEYSYEHAPNIQEECTENKKETFGNDNTAENLDSDIQRNNPVTGIWEKNFNGSAKSVEENSSDDFSVSSSLKEQLLLSDSTTSKLSHTTPPAKDESVILEQKSHGHRGIQVDVMNNRVYNFNIMTIESADNDENSNDTNDSDHIDDSSEVEEICVINQPRETTFRIENCPYQKPDIEKRNTRLNFKVSGHNQQEENFHMPDVTDDVSECNTEIVGENSVETVNDSLVDNKLFSEPSSEICVSIKEIPDVAVNLTEKDASERQENNIVEELNSKNASDTEKNMFLYADKLFESGDTAAAASVSLSEDFDETPFMPKHKQLPRTPVPKKLEHSPPKQSKLQKNSRKNPITNKKKILFKKKQDLKSEVSKHTPCEDLKKQSKEASITNSTYVKSGESVKFNSPHSWEGCQWRRDLEYASKAQPCTWVDKFEKIVKGMKPFTSHDVAENEMKKAIEDLHGTSWKKKEEAMLVVIQLAKHHPEVVQENTSKIAFVLCNEVKNFRQSVAGKAILTIGHLYEIMGKHFENKLRLVIAALLSKSGNRTLAAYFRLVIKTLFKIMNSSPQKAAVAFIYEGYKHTNKAARETAAQFLAILTENLGPLQSLAPNLSSHMLKCAATFSFDSSALTRYCGKRMLKVFMRNPDFEKIKDHHLDIDTIHNLSKALEQIASKGVGEDILPISLID